MRFRSAGRLEPEHVGRRVTVRRRLAGGGLGDVIGILEAMDAMEVVIRTKDGAEVRVAVRDVVATRVVGAPPDRRP